MPDPFVFDDFKEQLAYLEERGLDKFTIKKLGLEVKTATWLNEQGIKFSHLSRGIVWQLRNLRGEYTGKIGARVFYQKTVNPDAKRPKFLPPKGQVPGVYYSPLCNWDKLKYGQRIYICESYLKADICAMLGFHAVGVSGCWGWSHSGQLNWDFKDLPWRVQSLKPIVCMDSDVGPHNPKLYDSACRLNAEFTVRCGIPAKILVLPGGESKTGLDDYFVEHGKAKTIDFLKGKYEHLPNELLANFKIMGTEVCYVREDAKFVEIETGLIMSRGDFENATYATRRIWNEDGKPISVAKNYTLWEGRTEVQRMVYRPGAERIQRPDFYNTWRGMGVEPMAASVELFTSWVQDIFGDNEGAYFLDWWSWQLQHPGGKLTTALVLVGVPGIGKGWVTSIFETIFGTINVAKIPISVLDKDFNADVAEKQLLIVEETDEVGKQGQKIYNKLKDMITSTTIRLEKKGIDAKLIENTVNCFLTGNQIGIFKMDKDDRRFAVLEAREDGNENIANAQAYWDPRWEWLYEGGGASAIYGHLLTRDLRGFNPHGQAPDTQIKRDIVEVMNDPMDAWIQSWVQDPSVLNLANTEVDGSLASARELMWLFNNGQTSMCDIDRYEVNKMNRALKNNRVEAFPVKIKPTGGVPTTYFQIRQLPASFVSNAQLVNERLFWMHVNSAERGEVASKGDKTGEGSQQEKY